MLEHMPMELEPPAPGAVTRDPGAGTFAHGTGIPWSGPCAPELDVAPQELDVDVLKALLVVGFEMSLEDVYKKH